MVQEVVRRDPELQLLLFAEVEVLERRQVAVEERRTLDVRENERAVVPRSRNREAAPIDELVRPEVAPRIARQDRLSIDIWRTVDLHGAEPHVFGGDDTVRQDRAGRNRPAKAEIG